MENFTVEDKYRGDDYFKGQMKAISERYGDRITVIQNTKVVKQADFINCSATARPAGFTVAEIAARTGEFRLRSECPMLDTDL